MLFAICSALRTLATRTFGGTSLLAQSLEWGKPLAQRFHHGDLLTERTAGDVTASLHLTLEDVGYIGVGRLGPFHRTDFILQGSTMPARRQNVSQASPSS